MVTKKFWIFYFRGKIMKTSRAKQESTDDRLEIQDFQAMQEALQTVKKKGV